MRALHEFQQAFGRSVLSGGQDNLADLFVDDGVPAADRLRIYRNTARSVLTEALRLTYPAIDRLVGRDFFDMAAARFNTDQPPRSGYLNDYGATFPNFLAALPSAAALVYLPDVARFEWALSNAANAPDEPALDIMELAEVEPERHSSVGFEAHPSVHLLQLQFPADEIADAVISGDDRAMAAIDLSAGPIRVVVHRGPNGVEAERIDEATCRFLEKLFAGEPLGAVLDGAEVDAATLLAHQFAKGRLAGFRLAPSALSRESKEKES
jgi:hypothetical protein